MRSRSPSVEEEYTENNGAALCETYMEHGQSSVFRNL